MSIPWQRWGRWTLVFGLATLGCKASSKQQHGPLRVGSECPSFSGHSTNNVEVDELDPPGSRVYVVDEEFPAFCLDVECTGNGPASKRSVHMIGISDAKAARLFGAEKDGKLQPLVVVCDPADEDAETAGRVRAIYPGGGVDDLERILKEQGL